MGYDLHITRADDWFDSEKTPISAAEWRALVDSDPELEFSTGDFLEQRKESGNIERIYGVLWLAHPSASKGVACFLFMSGRVIVKNPDRPLRIKMVEMAKKLNARVIGDEDEEYGDDGEEVEK